MVSCTGAVAAAGTEEAGHVVAADAAGAGSLVDPAGRDTPAGRRSWHLSRAEPAPRTPADEQESKAADTKQKQESAAETRSNR